MRSLMTAENYTRHWGGQTIEQIHARSCSVSARPSRATPRRISARTSGARVVTPFGVSHVVALQQIPPAHAVSPAQVTWHALPWQRVSLLHDATPAHWICVVPVAVLSTPRLHAASLVQVTLQYPFLRIRPCPSTPRAPTQSI